VFLTYLIDAKEGRYVVTTDIPGAFMHVDIDEEVYVKLEGTMADLLVKPGESQKIWSLHYYRRTVTCDIPLAEDSAGSIVVVLEGLVIISCG